MHGIKNVALYTGASLLTAGLLFGVLFLLPRQAALKRVDELATRTDQTSDALERAATALEEVPGPDSITPARPGSVSTYLASLDSAVAVSNAEPLEVPGPIQNRWRSPALEGFNKIVSDTGFTSAANASTGALERTAGLLGYHQGVMSALRNVMEYDPRQDLSGSDAEMLLASIRAAGVGIGRTVEKLETQTFPGDPGLQPVISNLKQIETVRYAYEMALEDGRLKGSEYSAFISAIDNAQSAIIRNRHEFWQPAKGAYVSALKNARVGLSPFNTALHNLPD